MTHPINTNTYTLSTHTLIPYHNSLYVWATISCGTIRFSNLTYRGIVTAGPPTHLTTPLNVLLTPQASSAPSSSSRFRSRSGRRRRWRPPLVPFLYIPTFSHLLPYPPHLGPVHGQVGVGVGDPPWSHPYIYPFSHLLTYPPTPTHLSSYPPYHIKYHISPLAYPDPLPYRAQSASRTCCGGTLYPLSPLTYPYPLALSCSISVQDVLRWSLLIGVYYYRAKTEEAHLRAVREM